MIAQRIATIALGGVALMGGGTVAADQMQDPYSDTGLAYQMPVTSEVAQNDHIEIAKSAPNVTLSRWNDERRITIKPNMPGSGTISRGSRPLLSKRVQFKKGNLTAFVAPTATSSDFDIDFELAAKPAANVFTYTITGAQDLNFFYQGALSDEMPADNPLGLECTATTCVDKNGAVVIDRPENVVGSYAVYSKTKRDHIEGQTNYGAGKLFHIYRPKATDAAGNEVWATLTYSNGTLSVTVPQGFLDTASYPVVVDPTFGYTTLGATGTNWPGAGLAVGNLLSTYTASSGDSVTGFSFGAYVANSDTSTMTVGIAVYTFSGGLPVTLTGTPGYGSFSGATPAFYTTGSVSTALAAGITYTLAASDGSTAGGNASNMRVAMDTVTGGGNLSFSTFPNPWSSGFAVGDLMSIYATYTTSGGGGGSTPTGNPSDTTLFE